jgi:fluoride ion exporter CrcB/FEX
MTKKFLSWTYLGCFAMIGCFVRNVTTQTYVANHADNLEGLFPDICANMFGCWIMGLLSAPSRFAPERYPATDTSLAITTSANMFSQNSYLLVGLRTGLCGSITTFASWTASMAQLTFRGHAWSACFAYLVGTELALGSLWLGESAAAFLFSYARQEQQQLNTQLSPEAAKLPLWPQHLLVVITTYAMFAVALAGAAGAPNTYTGSVYLDRSVWFALVFSPFGAILRAELGAAFNGNGNFPMWFKFKGTWTANVAACAISGATTACGTLWFANGPSIARDATIGIALGFCGCLSTVSTWAVELTKLAPTAKRFEKDAWFYWGLTVVCGFGVCLVTYLPIAFTHNADDDYAYKVTFS